MADLPVVLSGPQLALHRALTEKDEMLGNIYAGALTVLGSGGNPDKLGLAAHGVRELMEKLPAYVDVQTKARFESLKVKAIELEAQWDKTLRNSSSFDGSTWAGDIDGSLRKFLDRLRLFFEWFTQHNPRRLEEMTKALRGLDPAGNMLPEPLERLTVSAWDEMRDFFVAVAHHRKQTSQDEFETWMRAFEGFLLERLVPRTFEDFDMIDAIVAEGEGNA